MSLSLEDTIAWFGLSGLIISTSHDFIPLLCLVRFSPKYISMFLVPTECVGNITSISSFPVGQGGIRPHMYCLPVLKRETHRLDLVKAATSGNPKFFLGTDTAPHAREAKISACGEARA